MHFWWRTNVYKGYPQSVWEVISQAHKGPGGALVTLRAKCIRKIQSPIVPGSTALRFPT